MPSTPTHPHPPFADSPSADADESALARALRLHNQHLASAQQATAELRQALRTFVRARRSQGAKPEHVLIEVKRAVRSTTTQELAGSPEQLANQRLLSRTVEWSIEEYFRD